MSTECWPALRNQKRMARTVTGDRVRLIIICAGRLEPRCGSHFRDGPVCTVLFLRYPSNAAVPAFHSSPGDVCGIWKVLFYPADAALWSLGSAQPRQPRTEGPLDASFQRSKVGCICRGLASKACRSASLAAKCPTERPPTLVGSNHCNVSSWMIQAAEINRRVPCANSDLTKSHFALALRVR